MGFVQNLYFIFTGEGNYYVRDHLDSTRVILNESGNVKQYYDYDTFGKTLRESIAGTEKEAPADCSTGASVPKG